MGTEEDSTLVSKELQRVAQYLDGELLRITGNRQPFVLVVFTPRRANYVSNGPREEVRADLKKLVDYWEEVYDTPDIPSHKLDS